MIPMWGRHEAARLCFASMQRIISQWPFYGIEIRVMVIYSNPEDKAVADDFRFDICLFPNDLGIGRKFNTGLDCALSVHEPDYICVLGCDDIVSTEAIYWYLPYLKSNVPFFGINNPAFYNLETGEAAYYNYKIGSGALRMHRVEELRRATWNEEEQRHILWPDNIGWGMDIESENNLIRAGYGVMNATPKTGAPLILDIKDEGSLSSWKQLVEPGHKRIERVDLERWFPEVKGIDDK